MTYMTVCLRSQSPLISSACQSQPDNGRDILSAQRDPPPRMTTIDSDFRRSGGIFPIRSRRIGCLQPPAWKSALMTAALHRPGGPAVAPDPSQTYESVKDLGSRLKPPPGWNFRAVLLDRDLVLTPDDRAAKITQDDLGNISTGSEAPTATTSREARHDQRRQPAPQEYRESAPGVPSSRVARSGPAVVRCVHWAYNRRTFGPMPPLGLRRPCGGRSDQHGQDHGSVLKA